MDLYQIAARLRIPVKASSPPRRMTFGEYLEERDRVRAKARADLKAAGMTSDQIDALRGPEWQLIVAGHVNGTAG